MSIKPVIMVPSTEIILRLKHVILLFAFLLFISILGYSLGYLYAIERFIDAKNNSSTELY